MRFTQSTFDARHISHVSHAHLSFEPHAVHSFGDRRQPKRFAYFGGSGTLPTFDILAVRRIRRRRNMIGTAEALDTLPLRGPFDVVIASGVLNFLSEVSLRRAARSIALLTNGVAFLELFSATDDVVGDTRGWRRRSASYYRGLLRASGLVQCGPHCYVGPLRTTALTALERAP